MNKWFQVALGFSFALLILVAPAGLMEVYATAPSLASTDNALYSGSYAGNFGGLASLRSRTLSSPMFCLFRHNEPVCVEKNFWIVTFAVAQGSGQICWSSRTRGACTSATMQAWFSDDDRVMITEQGATFNHWQLSCPSYYLLACGTWTTTSNQLWESVPFAGLVQAYF